MYVCAYVHMDATCTYAPGLGQSTCLGQMGHFSLDHLGQWEGAQKIQIVVILSNFIILVTVLLESIDRFMSYKLVFL